MPEGPWAASGTGPSAWPCVVLDKIATPSLYEIEMRFQLAIALALACAAATPVSRAVAGDLDLDLTVNDAGFAPAELKVPAGTRVKLQVANQTGASIEFESFELNRERVVPPSQKVVVYLSGLSAGRYEFFDDFHQERRGVLIVE